LPAEAIIVAVEGRARLLTPNPAALILSAVFPDKLPLAVTLILLKFSNILLAIWPD
jgi:hypothetical protein